MQVERALVVGAGIGGLGTAAALAQRGVDVDVVEIRPDANVSGVGISQPANALRALRTLGVLDEILAAGFTFDRFDFHDWQGNHIVGCDSVLGGDVPANCALSRRDLHQALCGAVDRAGAKVTFGTTIQDLVDDGHRVHVILSDGRSDAYDLVVGFDGVQSPLRRRLFGPAYDPVFTGYAVWRVMMPRPAEVTNPMLYQGDGTKAGVIPISPEHLYLLHVTAEPGNPHMSRERMADLLTERLAGYSGLIADLRDALPACDGIVYSPLSEVLLPSPWHRGRVIVLGDAAHACAPHLTQGAAMALEDAVVLAEELAVPDRPIETSLAAFADRRHPRAKLVQDVSHAILFSEMAITAEMLPHAADHLRQTVPARMNEVEAVLNQSF